MCWPRSCDAPGALCAETTHLVQQQCLADLPAALQKQRKGTLAEIILFVDEPERNPYDGGKFENTPQRGHN